jgi:hypothetical protein
MVMGYCHNNPVLIWRIVSRIVAAGLIIIIISQKKLVKFGNSWAADSRPAILQIL